MKNIHYTFISAVVGNQLTKSAIPVNPIRKSQTTKTPIYDNFIEFGTEFGKDALIAVASTAIPLTLGLSGYSAMATSGIIAGGITAYLNRSASDKQSQKKEKAITQSPKKYKETTDKFKIAFTDEKKIEPAFAELKKQLENKSPQEKVKIIQDIFDHFKGNNNEKFNRSDIWTGLLSTLSEQTNIDNKQSISLAVADGNKGTKLEFTQGQLKEFMASFDPVNVVKQASQGSFKEYINEAANIKENALREYKNNKIAEYLKEQINDKKLNIQEEKIPKIIVDMEKEGFDTIEKELLSEEQSNACKDIIDKYDDTKATNEFNAKAQEIPKIFIDNLEIGKPYLKLINHDKKHYTSVVIEKMGDDNYRLLHINSGQYKQADFNKQDIIQNLTQVLENNSNNYINFFATDNPYKTTTNKLSDLPHKNEQTNFKPYAQDKNACHQIAVMNLLKYFTTPPITPPVTPPITPPVTPPITPPATSTQNTSKKVKNLWSASRKPTPQSTVQRTPEQHIEDFVKQYISSDATDIKKAINDIKIDDNKLNDTLKTLQETDEFKTATDYFKTRLKQVQDGKTVTPAAKNDAKKISECLKKFEKNSHEYKIAEIILNAMNKRQAPGAL